eukprot:Rmarinus@m.15786
MHSGAFSICEKLGLKRGERVKTRPLIEIFAKHGILQDDDRVKVVMDALNDDSSIDVDELLAHVERHDVIECALTGRLAIPEFEEFCKHLQVIYDKTIGFTGGKNADYIPQLSEKFIDPNQYGISVCTVDGQRHSIGDAKSIFCIQSCSKPITYALGLNELGREKVHTHVGKEPSGRRFNEMLLDKLNRPHNPCINAGAIMSCSLVKPNEVMAKRFDHVVKAWQSLAGERKPGFANSTYLSESATADRNYCLAYMMKEKGAFPDWIDSSSKLRQTLEFYFMCCSLEMDAEGMAIVAATLANGGINPVTSKRVLDAVTVRDTLSVMSSCGMYDYSGEFAFRIGLPAKSGVGGCILVVVPGVLGLATFSPRLAADGNSVRGVEFCKLLERTFAFHAFDSLIRSEDKIDPRLKEFPSQSQNVNVLLYAAAAGNLVDIRRMVARGVNLNSADYDGRTALHLAASEGHLNVVQYLVVQGANLSAKDRYDGTPLADAKRHNREEVVKYLEHATQMPIRNHTDPCISSFVSLDVNRSGTLYTKDLFLALNRAGIHNDDPRMRTTFDFENLPEEFSVEEFTDHYNRFPLMERALQGQLVIPNFAEFTDSVKPVFESVRGVMGGENAKHVPQLMEIDPDIMGVAICSVDGQRWKSGDADMPVTAQAVASIINYCIAVNERGQDHVHKLIGFEPSGGTYNDLSLDHSAKPHNPFINTGAILGASLIKPGCNLDERFDHVVDMWQRMQGGKRPGFNNSLYLSELDHSDRNMCIGYMMKEQRCFEKGVAENAESLKDVIRLYYQCCAIETTCSSLSVVAATLANGGINPLTGERLVQPSDVRNCLSLMFHCGMNDYAGEWGFEMGFPAKSATSGLIMAVIPNVMGIVFYSPRVDKMRGFASVRGIEFFDRLSSTYTIHRYSNLPGVPRGCIRDPTISNTERDNTDVFDSTDAASRGDLDRLKSLYSTGVDLHVGDYDGRTPLHLAATMGEVAVVKYLLSKGVRTDCTDRWGGTPLSDAKAGQDAAHQEIAALLEAHQNDP